MYPTESHTPHKILVMHLVSSCIFKLRLTFTNQSLAFAVRQHSLGAFHLLIIDYCAPYRPQRSLNTGTSTSVSMCTCCDTLQLNRQSCGSSTG